MVLAMVFSLGAFGTFSVSADDEPAEVVIPNSDLTGIVLESPKAGVATTVGFTYRAGTAGDAPASAAKNTTEAEGLYLDLVSEKLVNTIKVGDEEKSVVDIAGFKIGDKWKSGAPTDKDIAGLFKKGGTLVLTDHFTKDGPTAGSVAKGTEGTDGYEAAVPGGSTWTLTATVTLQNEGKAPKFIVDYAILADQTGATAGYWVLKAGKEATTGLTKTVLDNLTIAYAGNGKDPLNLIADDATTNDVVESQLWGFFPTEEGLVGGLNVFAIADGAKPKKKTYLVKYAPYVSGTTAYAGTPAQKISVADQQAAPKVKIDYKKDQLKLKVDQSIWFHGEGSATGSYTVTEPTGTQGSDDYVPGVYADDSFEIGSSDIKADTAVLLQAKSGLIPAEAGKGFLGLKKGEKDVIDLENFLSSSETYAFVWNNASSKKPASAKTLITGAARQILGNVDLAPAAGKLKVDTKKYEFYDTAKGKWGGAPKVTANVSNVKARLKSDGKTTAASAVGTFVATYGVIDASAKKPKSGVLTATITGPAYYGKLAFAAPAEGTKIENGKWYNTVPAFANDFTVTNVGDKAVPPAPVTGANYAVAWSLLKASTAVPSADAFVNTTTKLKPVLALDADTDEGEYTLSGEFTVPAGADAIYLPYADISASTYSVSFGIDTTAPAVAVKGGTGDDKDDLKVSFGTDKRTLTIEFTEEIFGSGTGTNAGKIIAGDITFETGASELGTGAGKAVATISDKILTIVFGTPIDLTTIDAGTVAIKLILINGKIVDRAGNSFGEDATANINIAINGTKTTTPAGALTGVTVGKGTNETATQLSNLPTPDTNNKLVYKLGSAKVTSVELDSVLSDGTTAVENTDISISSATHITIYEITTADNKVKKFVSLAVVPGDVAPFNLVKQNAGLLAAAAGSNSSEPFESVSNKTELVKIVTAASGIANATSVEDIKGASVDLLDNLADAIWEISDQNGSSYAIFINANGAALKGLAIAAKDLVDALDALADPALGISSSTTSLVGLLGGEVNTLFTAYGNFVE
ncbi:hypothetical protein FACS1894219_05690 [Clostridia bacterium]|nr:hypothetical protein FACS1894219_05690 [Clostridia bacterium]